MQVEFGNFGGLIASYIYLTDDAPRFIKGHCILVALFSISFALTTFMTLYFRRENIHRDGLCTDIGFSLEDYSEGLRSDEREKGDNAIFYRYIV